MEDRLARLQAILGDQQRAFNETTVGKRVDVLLERPGRRMGQLVGKSPWLQSVHVEVAGAAIGDLVTVDIVSAGPNSLAGTLPAKRSEEHTSELQSLMRISYAVFCLKKKKKAKTNKETIKMDKKYRDEQAEKSKHIE